MQKTRYHIADMDCPSEESVVRMKLEGLSGIKKMEVDLEKRELTVFHTEENEDIDNKLKELRLGAKRIESTVEHQEDAGDDESSQSRILRVVLIINFVFFVIEITTGFLSHSMGLVADSLDMLADAVVYGLGLWAVGSAVSRKKRVATISGYFQMTLALGGLIEVIRRFFGEVAFPEFKMMMIVSFLALIANSVCLYLLQKTKSKEAHMKASMIFTSNDVIINTGVIIAGLLVFLTQSRYPDLIIGTVIFLIVVRGAVRILRLGR